MTQRLIEQLRASRGAYSAPLTGAAMAASARSAGDVAGSAGGAASASALALIQPVCSTQRSSAGGARHAPCTPGGASCAGACASSPSRAGASFAEASGASASYADALSYSPGYADRKELRRRAHLFKMDRSLDGTAISRCLFGGSCPTHSAPSRPVPAHGGYDGGGAAKSARVVQMAASHGWIQPGAGAARGGEGGMGRYVPHEPKLERPPTTVVVGGGAGGRAAATANANASSASSGNASGSGGGSPRPPMSSHTPPRLASAAPAGTIALSATPLARRGAASSAPVAGGASTSAREADGAPQGEAEGPREEVGEEGEEGVAMRARLAELARVEARVASLLEALPQKEAAERAALLERFDGEKAAERGQLQTELERVRAAMGVASVRLMAARERAQGDPPFWERWENGRERLGPALAEAMESAVTNGPRIQEGLSGSLMGSPWGSMPHADVEC